MNKKKAWDQNNEIDSGRFSGRGFLRGNNKCNEENEIRKLGKVSGLSKMIMKMINASGNWKSWN